MMTTPDIVIIDENRLCNAGGIVIQKNAKGAVDYRAFFYDAFGRERCAGVFDNVADAENAACAGYRRHNNNAACAVA